MIKDIENQELSSIEGGVWPAIAVAVGAYMGLLNKIEQNPDSYTWTMDWYYS